MGEVRKIDNGVIKKAFSEGAYNHLAKYIHKQYESGPGSGSGAASNKRVSSGKQLLTDQESALLLTPRNLSFVAAVTMKEQMFFSTVVTSDEAWAFYHTDEVKAETTLKLMAPESIVQFLKEVLSLSEVVATETSMTLTPVGILTLMVLIDWVKRQKLEALVLHLVDDEPLSLSELEEAFKLSYKSADLRWYLPFVMEAFGPFDTVVSEDRIDFKKGLKELEKLGLVKLDKVQVHLTELGGSFVSRMLEARGLLSFRSLFFDHGSLQQLPMAFCVLGDLLYLMMPVDDGARYCFKSIDGAKFEELVEMVMGPGDVPEMVEVQEASHRASGQASGQASRPVPRQASRPVPETKTKFCKYCGTQLSAEANFCKACGKSLAKTKA